VPFFLADGSLSHTSGLPNQGPLSRMEQRQFLTKVELMDVLAEVIGKLKEELTHELMVRWFRLILEQRLNIHKVKIQETSAGDEVWRGASFGRHSDWIVFLGLSS
jgi:hypothetical protein